MDNPVLNHLAIQAETHLFTHLMPFWTGPAVDHQEGGWMAWLSNDLRPDRSQPKGLIVHSRILWAFSAVYAIRPEPLYRAMAERAYEYLTTRFWDDQFGGAFWRLDDSGQVIDTSKKCYGQAFCVYALAEFARVFRSDAALQRTRELFELLERRARDERYGGYWEVRNRDWSEAADSRLSDKDLNEKKSMNNHLHVLEGYTNLYRVWNSAEVASRLKELIELFQTRILDPQTGHLHHFFAENWQVRSDTYTYGHDIEAAWLLCEAAEVLGEKSLEDATRRTALTIASGVLAEAIDRDGALCYEGKSGRVIDPGRECWPQAEAVVGFLNAWQISGKSALLEAACGVWNFIENRLADRVHGEWFWKILPDGTEDKSLPKVSEWKGPYHGSRACLEVMRRCGLSKQRQHN